MRPFAKISEVEVGIILIADGGFTCLCEGDEYKVAQGTNGELYVPCSAGKHYLIGQVSGEEYIGFYHKEPAK